MQDKYGILPEAIRRLLWRVRRRLAWNLPYDYAHDFLTDTGHTHHIFRNFIYKTHTATGFEYTKNWERYARWQPGSDNQQSAMISDHPTSTGMCVCKTDNCDQRIYRQILQDLLPFKTFNIDHKNVLESMQKFCKEGYITKTLSPVELLLAALSIALTMVLFVMEFCFYGPSKRFYQTLAKIDPGTPETRENVGMLNVCLGTSCLGAFRDLGRKAFERRFAGDVQTKGWLFQPCESDRGSYASSRGKQPTIEFPRSPSRGTGEIPSLQMVGYNHWLNNAILDGYFDGIKC